MKEPFSETDLVQAFAELTEATGAYLWSITGTDVSRVVRAGALADVVAKHAQADMVLAWISAEPDEEIDDTLLTPSDLDGDDEEYDDNDGEEDDEEEDDE